MRSDTRVPPLVGRARALAAKHAFADSCTDAVGRLLRNSAASVAYGTIAEIGTGCGVGTAWLASGLRPGVRLVTIEIDRERAAAARSLFAEQDAVHVMDGDWRGLATGAPFALLFADGGGSKEADLHAFLRPGGVVLIDDLTDPRDWEPERRIAGDTLRERWLADERFRATIVGVGADKHDPRRRAQALVATRLPSR